MPRPAQPSPESTRLATPPADLEIPLAGSGEGDPDDEAAPALPSAVLVIGRAIHPPWNEGTRVTARNLARASARLTRTGVVSVTNPGIATPEPVPTGSRPGRPSPTSHVSTSQPYGIRSDYAPLARLLRRLERVRPRTAGWVAHLVGAPLVLAPWARLRGGRVLAHVTLTRQAYQGWPERLRAALAWRVFDRWIAGYACASEAVRDDLIRDGRAPDKVHVVPPGIDTSRFSPGSRSAARELLGWEPEEFVVAYIGTISPIRFPAEDVFAGLREAGRRIPGLRMVVHAPVATHAYNLAWAESNIRRRLAGPLRVSVRLADLDEAEKVRIYRAADALLLPFAGPVAVEPPLTLLEGMAAGAVPFVTPAANRSGIVRNGINGFTWATPSELADALVACAAAAPGERAGLRAAAVATIERGYSLEATMRGLTAAWSRSAARRVAGGGNPSRGPMLRRRGLSVAIVGPDGAGKTTLVRGLAAMPDLDALPIYLGVDREAATHSLPTTRWLVRRRRRRATDPGARSAGTGSATGAAPGSRHGATPWTSPWSAVRPAARSLVRLALPLLTVPHELAEFGYRLLVGWDARRAGRTVLFDRFVTDSLVDALVDGATGTRRVRAGLLAAMGRTDLLLILDAPGDVLFARKGEHDPDRLEELRRHVAVAARRARRSVRIDATMPPQAVLEAAREEILAALAARASVG